MEADWRGLAGYSVQFQIQDTLKLTVRELDIPITAEEFSTLDTQIRQKFPLSVSGILVLLETFSIDSLNDYISVFMTTDTLRTSQHQCRFLSRRSVHALDSWNAVRLSL